MVEFQIAMLLLSALEKGPEAIARTIALLQQNGEWTQEQLNQANTRMEAIFASRAAKTDDQLPASEGGTGPG